MDIPKMSLSTKNRAIYQAKGKASCLKIPIGTHQGFEIPDKRTQIKGLDANQVDTLGDTH
jgi:hypothetical protein